jgi:cation:H+ antiporter
MYPKESPILLIFCLAVAIGLVILIWSADRFVEGAVASALNLGMTPMMVGLTVVAFGTSAPELLVSATAALEGSPNLAVGNAIGSNIANIALVLGVTALISAIPIKLGILKVEIPILLIATLCATALIADGLIDINDGLLMLGILIISLIALAKFSAPSEMPEEVMEGGKISSNRAYSLLAISIVALLLSSHILVWGASGIATHLGVSELVIGLTIVAIGTSLPELAAAVASAIKGHHDLALGNIIGSNLFNLLAVLAIPALISPPTIDETSLLRDYGFMLALTFGLAAIVLFSYLRKPKKIGRIIGTLLVSSYILYLFVLYQQNVSPSI